MRQAALRPGSQFLRTGLWLVILDSVSHRLSQPGQRGPGIQSHFPHPVALQVCPAVPSFLESVF